MDEVSAAKDVIEAGLGIACECASRRIIETILLFISWGLITFDVVTDWLTWGEYKDFLGIHGTQVRNYTYAFLGIAALGSLFWILETVLIGHRIQQLREVEPRLINVADKLSVIIHELETSPYCSIDTVWDKLPLCNNEYIKVGATIKRPHSTGQLNYTKFMFSPKLADVFLREVDTIFGPQDTFMQDYTAPECKGETCHIAFGMQEGYHLSCPNKYY